MSDDKRLSNSFFHELTGKEYDTHAATEAVLTHYYHDGAWCVWDGAEVSLTDMVDWCAESNMLYIQNNGIPCFEMTDGVDCIATTALKFSDGTTCESGLSDWRTPCYVWIPPGTYEHGEIGVHEK